MEKGDKKKKFDLNQKNAMTKTFCKNRSVHLLMN